MAAINAQQNWGHGVDSAGSPLPPRREPTRDLRRRSKQNGWELLQESVDGVTTGRVVANGLVTEPMAPFRIAQLDQCMKNILWMLDVMSLPGILENRSIRKLRRQFFKNSRCEEAVNLLLRKLREFVSAYVHHQLPPFIKKAVRIVAAVVARDGNTIAATMVGLPASTIVLYPAFWTQPEAFVNFHLLRLEPIT